jgi:glycosyltransferase involved in cell wall biosynthesis
MSNPILTIAISTYNRLERLEKSLYQIQQEISRLPMPSEVELLVVDNASTDETFNFLQANRSSSISIIRNSRNQGMLGNLSICALRSKGKYVWCLGDDDYLIPGMLSVVLENARLSVSPIIYLNYAHAMLVENSNEPPKYTQVATQIATSGKYPLQKAIQANSNLMTAIYTMVLRRDQAISCYSVVSLDKPFSSLNACVPTTVYALSLEPETIVDWIADPVIAVDLRVSWIRYAPVWIIERFPEMILEFVAWGDGKANFRYVFEEMKPGVKYWLEESHSAEFEKPTDFKFLRGLFNLYGDSQDREFLEKILGIRYPSLK